MFIFVFLITKTKIMAKKTTHKQRVLDAMQNGRTISAWYAINTLGNTRLAATIFTLKKDGHVISKEMIDGVNKFGDNIRYGVYTLVKQAD
jgi:hypothetical protein